MAYAAVTSLYHTIHLLLTSSTTSVAASTQTILKHARWRAERLQETLKRYDETKNNSDGVMGVDARIRDEARRLEDLIESEASAQFLSQSHQRHDRFSLNLDHLRHDVDCFLQAAEKMRADYLEELRKPPSPAAAAASSPSESSGNDWDEMVGFSHGFRLIRDFVAGVGTNHLIRLAITGMAGIGKTALVKKVFHDSLVKEKFECRAFVRVGQKYEFEEILRAALAQLNVGRDKMIMGGDENIHVYFRRSLMGRKFLIVLDDVWEWGKYMVDDFQDLVREEDCAGSCVLLTSRIQPDFRERSSTASYTYKMRLLKDEESWELLRRKVFGEEGDHDCPPQLVKAGKKIAENCEGLPLLILSVAQLLSKAPKSPEYWDKVAAMRNSVFEDAIDQIYEVLLPSYHYLNQNSKACFLYMCVFPKDYVVLRSKINNLWLADGVGLILDDIVSSSLAVVRQQSWSDAKTKACNLHVVYRHLCRREAENNKFIFILNTYVDGSIEGIKDKPHLAIYNNTLLAIKAVHNSIARVSTLRSLLCTGPYHQYQVPVCLELQLLRVLDALTIRFYEFPVEVVKLIQLRYLSLTTNANLSPSIHKLRFLEYLIVHQHVRIINQRSSVAESSSFVPVEIWELEQLKHLQIIGRNMPHPPAGAILSNLTKLLDVGVQTCATRVLEGMPKLEKLRIQIESAPDAAQPMSSFDHIIYLTELKSLGSVVVNPKLLPKPAPPPRFRISNFVDSLEKLSLSGFGYPWGDMSNIARLRHLEVLKLQCYAFRGEMWEAQGKIFSSLKYLLIDDTDLVRWTAADETFPNLQGLNMKNCHKLHEFPLIKTLRKIDLVDCNPLAVTCAKQNVECRVRVKCSWT